MERSFLKVDPSLKAGIYGETWKYYRKHFLPILFRRWDTYKEFWKIIKKGERMNKTEKLLICPFCKDTPIITLRVNSSFEGGSCPKCKRHIIEVNGNLFIELEEGEDGV